MEEIDAELLAKYPGIEAHELMAKQQEIAITVLRNGGIQIKINVEKLFNFKTTNFLGKSILLSRHSN